MERFLHLSFALDVDDDWPPVARENLVVTKLSGNYKIVSPPLFVKDLSVDDVLEATVTSDFEVQDWKHVAKSARSTVWIMNFGNPTLPDVLIQLRDLGCNVEHLKDYNYCAVDIPAEVPSGSVESILDGLDEDTAPVAYPSWRRD